jgi:hypothetical protein
MVDAWLATLDEAEQVLQGKKLIPFWRGEAGDGGDTVSGDGTADQARQSAHGHTP